MALTVSGIGSVQSSNNAGNHFTSSLSVAVGDVITVCCNGAQSTTLSFSDSVNTGNYPVIIGPATNAMSIYWIVCNAAGTPTITGTTGDNSGLNFNGFKTTGFVGTPTVDAANSLTFHQGTAQTSQAFSPLGSNFNNEVLYCSFNSNAAGQSPAPGVFTGWTHQSGFIQGYAIVDATSGTNNNQSGTYGAAQTWDAAFASIYDGPGLPLIGQTTPTATPNLGTVAGDMYWITSPAYADGNATALNVAIQNLGSATALLLGLFDQNGNLLASGTVSSPAVGLNTATISSTPIVYGRNYSISVQATTNVGIPAIASNNTGTGPFHANNTPNTVPSTLNGSPFVDGHGLMTLYATGSPSAGASGTPLGGPARTSWHWRPSGGTS